MSHNFLQKPQAVREYLQAQVYATQTLVGAWTKLQFNTPTYNDCFTVASSVFTCTVAGWYVISLTIYAASATADTWTAAVRNSNISAYPNSVQHRAIAPSRAPNLTATLYLDVGDTLQMQAYANYTATDFDGTLMVVRLS